MTTDLRLGFGYNAGIPGDAVAAWGARLIVTQDGGVDLVHDRTGNAGDTGPLYRLLEERYPLGRLVNDLSDRLLSRQVDTRKAEEVTLYADDQLLVIGNSNGSGGYFYVSAVLLPARVPAKKIRPTWAKVQESYEWFDGEVEIAAQVKKQWRAGRFDRDPGEQKGQ